MKIDKLAKANELLGKIKTLESLIGNSERWQVTVLPFGYNFQDNLAFCFAEDMDIINDLQINWKKAGLPDLSNLKDQAKMLIQDVLDIKANELERLKKELDDL